MNIKNKYHNLEDFFYQTDMRNEEAQLTDLHQRGGNLITTKNSIIPINESDVILFEKNNNISMPNYLKEFFLKYNGAEINKCFYKNHYLSILPQLRVTYQK